MAQLPKLNIDPTLEAMNKQLERKQSLESQRNYLGASSIGHECWRYLFYSFRGAEKRQISASGIKAIEDGFCQEDVTIKRLRDVNGIEIYNDDGNGNQIGFKMLLGHFRGHVDGVITGLLQAPKTPHVFEHKAVNETKFNKLKKLIQEKGEKNALAEWDETYFAQCQTYCHALQLERHYTVVCTPGGRNHTSVRTDYNKKIAEGIIAKAQSIIFDNWNIPAKLSENREFYKCKWCDYSETCHDGKFPLVNCKTCRYSEPIDGGVRQCLYKEETLDNNLLNLDTCLYHVYNPALIPAKTLDQQGDCTIYETETGFKFANCFAGGLPELKGELDGIFTSKELRDNIQFTTNLTKNAVKVQKEFDGVITKDVPKIWDSKLKDI